MSKLERLMDRKVPVWSLGLIVVLGLIGTIALGNIAIHTFKGGKKAGAVGEATLFLFDMPALIDRLGNATRYLKVNGDPFPGKSGFVLADSAPADVARGYLLLSRYDGDASRSVVEYWDLSNLTLIHRWEPPIDDINAAASDWHSTEIDLARDKNQTRMLIRHPLLMDNGDIVIKSRTPLTRVSACNEVVWSNDDTLFHHAVEADPDGAIWVATREEPATVERVSKTTFADDTITKVSPQGEILFKRFVAQMLLDHGMRRYVYGRSDYDDNPIHLNDIQPVRSDGPYWQLGDVFLSLRSHSLIVLYRPSTDEIIWYREGPWSHQHDVDVLDQHRISVMDNNSFMTFPFSRVNGFSDVKVYDFETDAIRSPWKDALESVEFQTVTEGLQTVRSDERLFVEEQNRGRMMEFSADGDLLWEYVNRGSDGAIYKLGWSRLLEPEEGAAIAELLKKTACP
ncbi:MAG: hypothetical protein KDA50_13500 [Rhodobacteraceae bacterium]|nr:hypothetical protein [Paracoccaceae bacterium]